MPYFEGTDKFGLLEQIQFNGRVPLNIETLGVRPTDPEIITGVDPRLEKFTKVLKGAKAVKDIVQGTAKVRAGMILLAPDPILGPVDEAVGSGLIVQGGWQALKGVKSLYEVSVA